MKHKAKWYLGLALGFLAGVVFVVSCGQEARSTAEEVLAAIGITFDPTGTDLSARNLQALGTELDARVVALETKVGTLPSPTPDLSGKVADLEAKIASLLDLGTELDDRIVALETKVGALPPPVPDLSIRVAALELGVASLRVKDSNLEGKFFYYESVTQAQISNSRIASLESRTTSLEVMPSQVQTLNDQLDTVTDQVQVVSTNVECLGEELDDYPPSVDWVALDSQTHVNGSVTLNLACPKSIRYLKVSATYSNDGPGQVNIYEIQAFGLSSPTTNLALNKTATAIRSHEAWEVPSMAVDGNPETRWASERSNPGPASVAVPHWIMVDLGQNYQINRIVIDAGYYNQDYTLLGKRE